MKYLFLFLVIISNSAHADLQLNAACEKGASLTIGAVGDFLMHEPFQRKAEFHGSFIPLWQKWLPYTESVDIMYGNLETPIAPGLNRQGRETTDSGGVRFDNTIYTSYELFNVHPQLLSDIKKSGFDIVSTANNHSLDRGERGVEKTIDELRKIGLTYVGTRKKNEKFEDEAYRIIERNGITTAWIACTAVYNIADPNNLMLGCEKNASYIYELIGYLKQKVDAVIVTPHWGEEMAAANEYQKRFARNVLEAGALAVIGAHPHVLQHIEKITTRDGRETVVAYSLGNFLGFHPSILQKTTMMLFMNLVKNASGTKIRDVQYMPAFIRNRTGNLKDVEVLPIDRNGKLINETELKSEAEQNLGAQAIRRILSIFSEDHLVEYGSRLDFSRMCNPSQSKR